MIIILNCDFQFFILREVPFGHFSDTCIPLFQTELYDQSEQLVSVLYIIKRLTLL